MTKKQTQTKSFTPPQPRSLRSRKRKCCDALEESDPSGEAVEAQPSHLEQQDTEGTVLKTTSPPKDPHRPLTGCTTNPSQKANKAGDTTAPKQEGDPVEESLVVTGFEGEQAIGGAVEGAGTEETVPTNQDCEDTPQEDHSVESSVKDDEGREEEDIKTQRFLSSPPHPLTVAQPHPQLPSKEVKVGDGDSQTDNEEEQCGEKNQKPKMEERDSEQREAIDERGVCLGGGRKGPPVEEDRSVEAPVKKTAEEDGSVEAPVKKTAEEDRSVEAPEKKTAEEDRSVEAPEKKTAEEDRSVEAPEKKTAEEDRSVEAPEKKTAEEDISVEAPVKKTAEEDRSVEAPVKKTERKKEKEGEKEEGEKEEGEEEEEKEEEEKLDEEQLQSGGESSHAGPSEVAYSGPEQVTGEGLWTGLKVDPLGSEQPVVLGEEELDTEGVVEKKQEGDRGGCGSNEPEESPPRAPTSIPLEAGAEREHQGEVQSSPTQRERGAEDGAVAGAGAGAGTGANPRALSLAPADRGESSTPPPTKPGPGREGHNQAAVTPGGSEENNHSASPDLTRDDDDAAVVDPFGALALDYVSDSQLNTITLTEEEEGEEDATELVCGLIRELSSLNRVVMATHRELETLRRGNKTARPPPRRGFPPRRSEI
ncbi:hypothetical protein J4Q44_G00289090 [Coregonus suidteri]|uniref:Uncharacterized protein n=1 Tax=Coregonus suidteri TaxID=861788 RepID=A0AAN8LGW2_9TELE